MDERFASTYYEFVEGFRDFNPTELAFDTETTSLKYLDISLDGFSVCDGDHAMYVNTSEWIDSEIISAIGGVLHYNELLIMHNAPFDLKVLKRYGLRGMVTNVFDTMVACHLLNENLPSKALKFMVEYKCLDDWDQIKKWDEVKKYPVGSKEFMRYGLKDSVYTWKLYKLTKGILSTQNLSYVFDKIEMPFQFVLCELESNGIKVKIEEIENKIKECEKHIYDLEIALCTEAEIPYWHEMDLFGGTKLKYNFNFRSTQQVASLLQGKFNITIRKQKKWSKAKGKEYVTQSVDAKFLQRISVSCNFAKLLLEYRSYSKICNTFLKGLSNACDSDCRVRSSFHNTVAVTGRLSSSAPNLENIPKDDDVCDVRALLVAEEGKVFIIVDYSGQELRILADVSGDEQMLRDFENDVDIHLAVANNVFELNIPENALCRKDPEYNEYKVKYDKERGDAKNKVVFPILYGSTEHGISASLGVSKIKASYMMKNMFKRYPQVGKMIEDTKNTIMERGWVANKTGRRRRFPDVTNKSFRQGPNFLIQGFAADMMKAACNKISDLLIAYNNFEHCQIVNIIHDEVIYEVDEAFAEQAMQIIKDGMINCFDGHPIKMSLPLDVEARISKTYSKKAA